MTNQTIIEDLTLVPVPVWWQSPWVWLAFLIMAGVGVYFLLRWWRSRPVPPVPLAAPPPAPPPHVEALRQLAELKARRTRLSAYEVALECSEILRNYTEQRFNLPIRYQTTREFLSAAQSQFELDNASQSELGAFLLFFDELKFARASATAQQTLEAIEGGERFIRHCSSSAISPPAA